ncbi:MAG: hypothetical protein Tsb0014_35860 [Pleurocapsa sp.]
MRNRARRRLAVPEQNLDSFLDILTNTVGVLMFISLFVTLIATGSSSKSKLVIQTPLASETKKEPLWFEIRDNQVTYLNKERVDEEQYKLFGNLPYCVPPDVSSNLGLSANAEYLRRLENYNSCKVSRSRRLSNFQFQTEYYDVVTVDGSLRFEPVFGKDGETEEQLRAESSQFNQVLAKFDPSKQYLAFIVRPDSFTAFRAARKQAWAQGYEVGWEPHPSELPIQFGERGRAVGVQ